MRFIELENLEIDFNRNDYPDFCDAFIEYAEYRGKELTDKQYDYVNDNFSEEIHEYIFDNQLYL